MSDCGYTKMTLRAWRPMRNGWWIKRTSIAPQGALILDACRRQWDAILSDNMNPKNTRKHIVVLTGAGISAESGLETFRGDGGLWQGHSVYEVATPEAWERDPQLVLDFYNMRRRAVRKADPNAAHKLLAALEDEYQVTIVTQNVDDLHERAGSSRVIHLHGEILKGQSARNPLLIVDLAADIALGDLAPDGAQLRPHVVWFGDRILVILD